MFRLLTKYTAIFIIFFNFLIFSLSAQEGNRKIKIYSTKEGDNIHSPLLPVTFMAVTKVWPVDGYKADSILWEARMQSENYYTKKFKNKQIDSTTFAFRIRQYLIDTAQTICDKIPDALYVLVKTQRNFTKVCLLKRYNPYLDKEVILSYPTDSLRKWTVNHAPANAVQKLSINFPYCISDKVVIANWDIRLIPFKTAFSFSDKRLNQMPLSFSAGKVRVAKVDNADIFIYKEEYSARDSNFLVIKIKEGGVFQKDMISNSLHYKHVYGISDTLIINSKLFKIDSIAKNWSYLYLRPLKGNKQYADLADKDFSEIQPYFPSSKKYLVLDFWGTWCGPCIKTLPELRGLYERAKSKIGFLSICVDSSLNINKAKEIFRLNNIKWPQIFSDINYSKSIASDLHISCFPTYMVLAKGGDIVYSDCGTDGFIGLQKLIKKLAAK